MRSVGCTCPVPWTRPCPCCVTATRAVAAGAIEDHLELPSWRWRGNLQGSNILWEPKLGDNRSWGNPRVGRGVKFVPAWELPEAGLEQAVRGDQKHPYFPPLPHASVEGVLGSSGTSALIHTAEQDTILVRHSLFLTGRWVLPASSVALDLCPPVTLP